MITLRTYRSLEYSGQVWTLKDRDMPLGSTKPGRNSACLKDGDVMELFIFGGSISINLKESDECPTTPTILPTTTTVLPTTTTVLPTTTTILPTTTKKTCPKCRNVVGADLSLNGHYELQASGDSRCSLDGCLYRKKDTSDLYCFVAGKYTVEAMQNACPTA